jgi:AcrR family transcriptional regulator
MGRPRLHDERTRAELLDAAEVIVGKDGIDALSVRSVAGNIGASTRAVYSVFGSKEALLGGLAERAFELLMDAVDAVPISDDPGFDLSQALVRGFRPFAVAHPDLFRLAFVWSPVQPGPGVLNASAAALTRLTGRIERAQAAGLLPKGDINQLVLELSAVCQGLASLELCGMLPGRDAERIWSDSVGDLLAGLRTRAGAVAELGAR